MAKSRFHALFSDVGGVLGTNGWDTRLRRKIAETFACPFEEIERRHHLFDSFERGHMSFEEYLTRVFFDQPRLFTVADLRDFAYDESVGFPDMIEFLGEVKRANQIKLALISNEGEGLTEHRVRKFGLRELADFLVFSHCVHLRKPDREIWQLALRLAQAEAAEVIYLDDRAMFVDIAAEMGFAAIHHVSLEKTREELRRLGLAVEGKEAGGVQLP